MRRVTRFAVRELLRSKSRLFLIVAILAGGVAVFVGTLLGLASIRTTAADLYAELRMADAQVFFTPTLGQEVPLERIASVPGVRAAAARLAVPGSVELRGQAHSAMFVFVDTSAPAAVNAVRALSGEGLSATAREAVLDAGFARIHGVRVGEDVSFGIQGFFTKLRVRGIGVSPDFLLPNADPNFFYTIPGSLAVVYLPMRVIEDMFGYAILNEVDVQLEGATTPALAAVTDAMRAAGLEIDHALRRSELYAPRKLEYDLATYGQFLPAIIAVFGSISLLITLVLVRRLVHARRRQIGALVALGYPLKAIARAYLRVGLFLGALATGIGIALAWPISILVVQAYQNATGFPVVVHRWSAAPLVAAASVAAAAMAFASTAPFLRLRKLTPAQMLRDHDAVAATRASALLAGAERFIQAATRPGSPWKLGFRNALRSRGRLSAWIAFTSLSLALSFTFLLFNRSMYQSVIDYFALNSWDLMVQFDAPIEAGRLPEIRAVRGVASTEPFLKGFVRMSALGDERYYQLVGLPAHASLRRLDLLEGAPLGGGGREIVLDMLTSRELRVGVGGVVEVASARAGGGLRLVGITNNYTVAQGYTPLPVGQALLDQPGRISGCFVRAAGDAGAVEKALRAKEYVSHIIRKQEVNRTLWAAMREITNFLWLYFGLATMCSVFLIYAGTLFSVLDHDEEYATLRALGYGRRWIVAMLCSEVAVVVVASFVACLPVAYGLCRFFSWTISKTNVFIPIRVDASHYLAFSAVFVLMFFTAVFPGLRAVEALDVPSMLRRREVG